MRNLAFELEYKSLTGKYTAKIVSNSLNLKKSKKDFCFEFSAMKEEFQIAEVKVNAPALLIMGEKDYYLKFQGMNDYIRNEGSKLFVPRFETVYIPEGSHFVQEQFPDQVNQLIIKFLKNHT